MYKAVFHVNQNEESGMNKALNNAANLLAATPEHEHDLVVVCNGPGAKLVTLDEVAPFLERIKMLTAKGVRFQVCRNSMKHFEIAEDQVAEGCEFIPAGIVALIDFQNEGFAYIKP